MVRVKYTDQMKNAKYKVEQYKYESQTGYSGEI